MELEFIMDGGADALNGTIWFPNTPSPPYEQLSPVRQNRRDPIATQHVSFLLSVLLPRDNRIVSRCWYSRWKRRRFTTLRRVSINVANRGKSPRVLSVCYSACVYQPISLLCSRALYSRRKTARQPSSIRLRNARFENPIAR